MKIIRRGVNPEDLQLCHCKVCDSILEVESEKDYDKMIPLSTIGYDERIKKAVRVFVKCPICGNRIVREHIEYADGHVCVW